MNQLVAAPAACAVALGLLFGAIPAQAQTVEKDGDTVRAIHDLDLNGVTYDVEFSWISAAGLYGDPSIFDFSNSTDAKAAVQAVNDVLNADGGAFHVGPDDVDNAEFYRIGFENFVRHFGGLNLNKDVTFTKSWNGSAPDTGSPGAWITSPDPDDWPFITDAMWADFIVVDTPGSGNQPPTADADGPYTGTAGVALSFDGNGSDDPDGTIDTYDWEYGDGTTDFNAGLTPSHTYVDGGTYNVILTVTDNGDLTNSATTTATIGEASQPPEASRPTTGTSGTTAPGRGPPPATPTRWPASMTLP